LAGIISVVNLTKSYASGVAALKPIDLDIEKGEIFALLGPNGAGKTTAVKLLLGLARPTTGAANVLGRPLGDRQARRRIGYLPELFRYPHWLTAAEVIDVHARLLGSARTERLALIADLLERVGLSARAADLVGSFSKGMQQRLGLAVALTGDPHLVILDEPTSALDPIGRHDVRRIIETLRAQGTAVILNSHLLTEVERVCDHIAIVDRGEVVAHGTVDALLGTRSALRLRLTDVSPAIASALARHGALESAPPWYTIADVAEERVPGIVAELVALGAAVHGVEVTRATLEERFLQMLAPAADADDRVAHAP
jgi:ABC-2 type transport system ATP-binding protein